MNPDQILQKKIELYKYQNEISKKLKEKQESLNIAHSTYSRNIETFKEQSTLIQQLLEVQNTYSNQINELAPVHDPNIPLFRQYRNLVNDMEFINQYSTPNSEIAFPFDEEILPKYDQYSHLYYQIEQWISDKTKKYQETDTETIEIQNKIEKLVENNEKLTRQLENTKDLSQDIRDIHKQIREKQLILNQRDELVLKKQQKETELEQITRLIRNQEQQKDLIKMTKEVNVQALTHIQTKYFAKLAELNQAQQEKRDFDIKFAQLCELFRGE